MRGKCHVWERRREPGWGSWAGLWGDPRGRTGEGATPGEGLAWAKAQRPTWVRGFQQEWTMLGFCEHHEGGSGGSLTHYWNSQAPLSACCVPGTKNTGDQQGCSPRGKEGPGTWGVAGTLQGRQVRRRG